MGARLTKGEKMFLTKHGIDPAHVLDATGLKRAQYKPIMKDGGYRVAITDSYCVYGHRLRSASGRCVECNPSTLAFARRYEKAGYVYIARSRSSGLIKVGISQTNQGRIKQLNGHKLAGATDWELSAARPCPEAGRAEYEIHAALAAYRIEVPYAARSGTSREVFDCSLPLVVGIYNEVMEKYELLPK